MHHFLSSSLFFTLLLSSTSASPLARRNGDYSKIHRQAVPGSGPRNGPLAFDKTYRKHGWTSPVASQEDDATNSAPASSSNDLNTAAESSGAGNVSATPRVHDSEFLCPVTIGGQTLNLNLDTGSADLWVFNTALPASDLVNHTSADAVYDASKSSTFTNVPSMKFGVSYGDGSQTYGTVGSDTVEVGGITVMGQAIELPTAVSSMFTADSYSSGILGLGFQSSSGITPNAQPTFFENAVSSLQAPVFTANLKANTAGNYQFGFIDHTAYSGSINYTPVNSSGGYWQFQTKAGGSPGIADTGSSLLLLDDDIVNAYWKQVPGHSSDEQGITFPCGTTLPDFQIELGESYTATIAGSLIDYTSVNSTICYGGIQSNSGQGLNVFGDIMFESQFVVFDAGNMQIGFAPHAA